MACLESLGIGFMAGVLISAIVALTAIILLVAFIKRKICEFMLI